MQQINFMSVDLEDYFCDLPFSTWGNYNERVITNTMRLLHLFKKYNVKATFFTLGYIAEKFPELIYEIIDNGHEIASHGYAHLDLRKNSREKIKEDINKSINILEDISGKEILGFRAPFFSIDENTFWIFEYLEKKFTYDSSIFPTKTPLYGISNAPTSIYKPTAENPRMDNSNGKLIEIPLAIHRFPIFGNVPIAGGFHLRFLPYFYLKYGINSNQKKDQPVMIYIHPKDIDIKMPRIDKYAWHYYYNLKNGEKKFEKLLKDFRFSSVKKILNL